MYQNILQWVFDTENTAEAPSFIEPRGNMVRKFTRAEVAEQVSIFARGMAVTEFRRGRRIAIIAKTSFHSFIVSLGNLLNGCVNVMIPVDAQPDEQQQALSVSRAEALIIEDFDTARAVIEKVQYLPQLRQIIVLNSANFEKQAEILTYAFDELMKRGAAKEDNAPDQLEQIEAEDDAYIFFLRDEFGHLRPLSLTHREVMEHLSESMEALRGADILPSGTVRTLSVVPFHRPFSHIAGFFLPMLSGFSFMAVDKGDAWKSGNLPIKPQMLIAESQFLEELRENVRQNLQQAGGAFAALWEQAENWAKQNQRDGEYRPGLLARLQRIPLQFLLRRKLAEQIGGAITMAVSIDEKISPQAKGFYATANIPVILNQVHPQDLLKRQSNQNKAAA